MTGAEHPGGDTLLDCWWQIQQPYRVRNVRPRSADSPRELLVCHAEIVEKLLVGSRFLERVELLTVKILDERISEQVILGCVAYDRGNPLKAGALRGAPASLTHHEFVVTRQYLADHYGLKQANFTNG